MQGRPPGDGRSPLFRPEVVDEQRQRWLGRVLLVPRVSHSILVGFAALIVAGVVGVVAFGEYTRKARLAGLLAPQRGVIQIVAQQPGVLTQVSAQEGLEVAAGIPLAVISAERRSQAVGATQDQVVRQLRARRDSMRAERRRHLALFDQQVATLEQRLQVLEREAGALEAEAELQRARGQLAAERQRALRGDSIATEQNLLAAEEDALDQALALQTLERDRTTLARTRLELAAERDALPLREEMQLAEIDRAVAELEQQLAEAEAEREIVIWAPENGTVTAVQAVPGSSVGPDTPLMLLLPAGSVLEARLYGPSRAIGFVRPGQRVRMRYEAFPHQKFGQYEGVVRSVSRSTIGPAELGEARLPGLVAGEPVYRVTVELATQSATAYGQAVPLQPGMPLEADVLIETRRLYQWVLDPLYSLTGRGRA